MPVSAWKSFGVVLALSLAGTAAAQSLTEFGAAAAAGATGGAAGKSVSDGIDKIFGKVNDQTKAAAKTDPSQQKTAPAPASAAPATVAPPAAAAPAAAPSAPAAASIGLKPRPAPAPKVARTSETPKREEPPVVPDPPALPSRHAAVVKASPPPRAPEPVVEPAPVPPPPPPPPPVTAEDLKTITPGAAREDVLKLGVPASRITMYGEEGHLLEIYSYITNGAIFGVVRLSDGAVSKVELR